MVKPARIISLLLLLCVSVEAQIGRGFFPSGDNNGLLTGLAAYYKYDEASGNALDSTGNARHLTENGTVEADGGGVINGARSHAEGDDAEYFSRASEAWNTFAAGDFTITMWAKVQEKSEVIKDQVFISKADNTDGIAWAFGLDWSLSYANDYSVWFSASPDGTFGSMVTVIDLPIVAPLDGNEWYFFFVKRIGNTVTVGYSPQGDATILNSASAAWTDPMFDNSTIPLAVGVWLDNGGPITSQDTQGLIDEMGIWNVGLDSTKLNLLHDKTPYGLFD